MQMYAPCVRMTCTAICLPCMCVCILMLFILKHIYIYILHIFAAWYGLVSFWCHLHSYIMFFVSETLLSSLSTLGQIVLLEIGSCSHHTQVLVIITLGSFLYLRICRQESSPYGLSMGNRVQVATGTFVANSFTLSFLCKRVVFCMSFLMHEKLCLRLEGTGGLEPPTKEQIEACVPEVRMEEDDWPIGIESKIARLIWIGIPITSIELNWDPVFVKCDVSASRKIWPVTFFRPEIRRKLVRCV